MPETAPGALLMAQQAERKFLLDASSAEVIWRRASARLHPQLRDADRPVTYHRTTYFDTLDHAYYRGAGPVAQRVRVREYATASSPGATLLLMRPCFLELKQSSHGMRSKTRLEIDDACEVDRHLDAVGGPGLVPCLTTWYQRAALTDGSERIRITLDSEIRYCAPQPLGAPCAEAPPSCERPSALVLEIKVWGVLPPWLRKLVRSIEEAADFSKFRAGMQAVGTGCSR